MVHRIVIESKMKVKKSARNPGIPISSPVLVLLGPVIFNYIEILL